MLERFVCLSSVDSEVGGLGRCFSRCLPTACPVSWPCLFCERRLYGVQDWMKFCRPADQPRSRAISPHPHVRIRVEADPDSDRVLIVVLSRGVRCVRSKMPALVLVFVAALVIGERTGRDVTIRNRVLWCYGATVRSLLCSVGSITNAPSMQPTRRQTLSLFLVAATVGRLAAIPAEWDAQRRRWDDFRGGGDFPSRGKKVAQHCVALYSSLAVGSLLIFYHHHLEPFCRHCFH